MRIKKHIQQLTIALGGALLLATPMTVFAGGINANESAVVGAASGTFVYEGKSYLATSAALGALQAKLSADDVDLSESQASSAITQMYSNIARGVSEGYLVAVEGESPERPVGGSSVTVGNDNTNGTLDDTPKEEFVVDNGFLDTILDNNSESSEKTEKPSYTTYASDPIDVQAIIDNTVSKTVSAGTETDGQTDGTSEKKNVVSGSESKNENEKENRKETSKNAEGQTVTAQNAAFGMTYDKKNGDLVITRDATSIGENGSIDTSSVTASVAGILCVVLTVVMLCLGLVCAGVAYRFECYPHWGRKGEVKHRTKKKIRRALRIVLGIALTLEVIGVVAAIGALIGFANNGGVDRNLKISDYYNQVYREYKEDEAAVLTACGYPENLLERTTVYTTDAVDEDKVLAEMDTYLRKYEELTAGTTVGILISDENRATLELELTNRYAAITASDFIEAMKQSQQDLAKDCMKLLAAMSLLIALDCIVLFRSNRAKQKSVRCTAISVLTAVVLVFAVLAVVLWKKPYQSIVVYPESLYTFMMTFIRWALELYTWVAGAAFAVFCGLMVWWKILEKK